MRLIRPVLAVVFSCSVLLAVPAPVEAQTSRAPEVQAAYDAGMKLLEEEKYEEAIVEFTKATADDTFAEAYLGQGDALRMLEDYGAAIQSYTRANNITQDLPRVHFGLAMCFKEQGQLEVGCRRTDRLSVLDILAIPELLGSGVKSPPSRKSHQGSQ